MNQWRERIEQFLPGASIGTIKGPIIDVDEKDIIIGSVQSLSMKDYPDTVFKGISFLVVDECHRIGTEVFSRALLKRCFRYTLGLSATVHRKDGMSQVFYHFLGDIVHKVKPRVDCVKVVQYMYNSDDERYSREEVIKSLGKPNMSLMINNIAAFEPRNEFIIFSIISVIRHEPQRKVLVLSDRKEQLATLHKGLVSNDISAGFYYGGLKPLQLAESEKCQVILATFPYAAEGMDCRGLDTLYLVSPKSDIEQSCGRILRAQAHERESVPLIVDIADGFSVFQHQAKKRRLYYKRNKYDLVQSSDLSKNPHNLFVVIDDNDISADDVGDNDANLHNTAESVPKGGCEIKDYAFS